MLREMSLRVLLVEDDDLIARPLVRTLEREGYDVDHVTHGAAALEQLQGDGAHLVLLDLGLPDMDGLEVCRRARSEGFGGGIMILTARGGELDRVVGLDIGADDYLAKPFALSELLARTRALLRRAGGPAASSEPDGPRSDDDGSSPAAPAPGASRDDGLEVDQRSRRVWVAGEELVLTAKEFDLLALLDSERGAVLTREDLINAVWDENWFGSTKMLDATVGRLRQKLEDRGSPVHVVTVRGVGFRLERDPPDA